MGWVSTLDGYKLLRREEVGGGVSFVKWGEGTMMVGARRSGGYFFLRGVRPGDSVPGRT